MAGTIRGQLGINASLRVFIDDAPLTLAHSHHRYRDSGVFHTVDKSIARTAKLDFVEARHAVQTIGHNLGLRKSFVQLLFELRLQCCAEFIPLFKG